jgi:tetratricopeptide (TPR) repeat protein
LLLGRGLYSCSVPRARTCGMVEIEEDSSSDEDEKTVRIPRYGDDDYVEDPVIKAQQDRSFAERDRIKRDFEEKLFVPERAADARKYANELFQQEKFEEAADAYLHVLKLLPAGSDNVAERATVFNNLAAVRIRQWRWRDALEMCAEVHKRDPENAKAFYRKAQAYRGLKEFRNALTVIDEACEARKKVGLRPDFELDKLRGFVEKDLKKVEDIEREKKEAELRAARRAENTKEKREERAAAERAKAEERRAAAKAAAAAAPSLDELAAAAIAGGPESTTTGSTDAPVDAPAQGTSTAR